MSSFDPPSPCTLDVEASGFGRGSYPVEIGWVRADGCVCCTLVRPVEQWTHWDPAAERVHGITREVLLRHGRPVTEVADMLNRDLAGMTVYSDAWAHDFAWVAQLFEAAGLPQRFRLESVAALLPEHELPQLAPLQQRQLRAMGLTRHRASNDARALRSALVQLVGVPGSSGSAR